ncbi:MAG: ankyrin repeat domain-containing protein [Acidobacteriota bacterium]|nr:ankyrin repeat domain-containing protein [Acidobacteriota bacterium]MDQ5836492.1 ankyrin repeat domain-containing protein [Acidobacteriota bacterium]
MPRRTDLLERIRIPEPCDADWDSMVGNDQVRFCSHCSLNVTNLSSMTRSDARRLVRESGGRLCIRYYRRPDGSVLTAPAVRLQQIARRASKLAAGAFGAMLTLSAPASAQTGTQTSVAAQNAAERVVRAAAAGAHESDGASLQGTAFDADGAVIPNAYVALTNRETGTERDGFTDGEGVYRFKSLPAGTYSLKVVAAGLAAFESADIELKQGAEQTEDARLEAPGQQEAPGRQEAQGPGGERMVRLVTMGGPMIVLPKEPLVQAASDGDLKAVKQLLALGADANVLDKATHTTALAEAVGQGSAEIVSALIEAGADVNLRDGSRQTALMSLGEDTSPDIARALLSAGAKVNLKDNEGDTALTLAAGRVNVDVLRVLIEAGAKVNAKNDEGQTALMAAAQEGLVENVRALVLAGADMSLKNKEGDTALKLARDNEHEDVASLLAAFGADE